MKKLLIILILFFVGYFIFVFFYNSPRTLYFIEPKTVYINDNGLSSTIATSAANIDAFLQEQKITLAEHDQILPEKNTPLSPGTNIFIKRAVKITIAADGQKRELWTLTKTVENAILDSQIALGEDDLTSPKLTAPIQHNLPIIITRVEIKEELVKKPIEFKTISEEDDKLGWRIKKIKQPGVKGIKEITYKVVSHDGQEISRKVLAENITQEPQPEIIIQGTYVKIGKAHTGLGTWYAWQGGLFAASPWLPMGSFAKVTSKENGKSVIVQINDRGPFGPNRIIDLDKVAFAKIASIGAGVIDVNVEEILN